MTQNLPVTTAGVPSARRERLIVEDSLAMMDTARFEHMHRIATAMSAAKLMPDHLRSSPADCLLVVEQAHRWGMSPFAMAPETYSVGGKLGYSGKLVAAVVNVRANLEERLSYAYEGDATKHETLKVTVSGKFRGEREPRRVEVTWKQGFSMSKGAQDKWKSQPEQQLAYFGARAWARRHVPEVILGVWTPDELQAGADVDAAVMRDVTQRPAPAPARPRTSRLDALVHVPAAEPEPEFSDDDPAPATTDAHDPDTGEVADDDRSDDAGTDSTPPDPASDPAGWLRAARASADRADTADAIDAWLDAHRPGALEIADAHKGSVVKEANTLVSDMGRRLLRAQGQQELV